MWHMKQNHRSAQVTIRYIKGQILQKHKYMKYAMNNKISYMLTQKFGSLNWKDF